MQISDFLQKNLSRDAVTLLAYESELLSHFDAYLRQLWPEGRLLIVTESTYRDYVEGNLLAALSAQGYEPAYCLCVKSAGVTYRAQIDESLGDGVLDNIVGIAALGSAELFASVRERASLLGVGCCALMDTLPPRDCFESCGEKRPVADAIFFDLDSIAKGLRGDWREAIQSLEVDIYALNADIATAHALGAPVAAGVEDALHEAVPPRIPAIGNPSEDELAELCEAYAWRAAAARLYGRSGSLQTVFEYAEAGGDFPSFPIAQHARLMDILFEAVLELESLEISPEDCANRQPPKEFLRRTLQQILLEDGVKFDWLKRAEDNFEDRVRMRLTLNTLVMNWDDYCAKLRPIADMMHAISVQNVSGDEDDMEELDSALKNLWIHAARFAPVNTFLRVFNSMNAIEPALYI